jgi:hypothetical protein
MKETKKALIEPLKSDKIYSLNIINGHTVFFSKVSWYCPENCFIDLFIDGKFERKLVGKDELPLNEDKQLVVRKNITFIGCNNTDGSREFDKGEIKKDIEEREKYLPRYIARLDDVEINKSRLPVIDMKRSREIEFDNFYFYEENVPKTSETILLETQIPSARDFHINGLIVTGETKARFVLSFGDNPQVAYRTTATIHTGQLLFPKPLIVRAGYIIKITVYHWNTTDCTFEGNVYGEYKRI